MAVTLKFLSCYNSVSPFDFVDLGIVLMNVQLYFNLPVPPTFDPKSEGRSHGSRRDEGKRVGFLRPGMQTTSSLTTYLPK